eukprot:g10249.t1
MDDYELRRELRRGIEELFDYRAELISQTDRNRLIDEVIDETLGLGPIDPLLRDPTVSDILVNGPKAVYVERRGKLEETGVTFHDDQHLLEIVQRIASRAGRRLDESSPMVDARLEDGSRVNAVIAPLALDGALVSIRRFGARPLLAGDLIARDAATPEMIDFLEACIRSRLNIVVSGGTGSGKTTFLNMLSAFIPEDERIATIEDAAELQLQQPHVARMETRPENVEGRGLVTARDLLRNSLRMRPDRIIIGECRGEESFDMIQAMTTGHDGSMTTIHANDARDAISRLEMLVGMAGFDMPLWFIQRRICEAIHIVVHCARLSGGVRKMTTVVAGVVAVIAAYRFAVEWFFRKRQLIDIRLHEEFKRNGWTAARSQALFKQVADTDQQSVMTRLYQLIEQSGLSISITRLLEVSAGLSLAAGFAAAVFGPHWTCSIPAAMTAAIVPLAFLQFKRRQRISNLTNQIPETFELMSRAVRAGQTMAAAFRLVADESKPPIASEFRQCCEQQDLGLPVDVTLRELARRNGVVELQMFVVAMLVQRQTGGSPVEVLNNLSGMIRKRLRMKGKVKALTGEGRMQAIVLSILPIVAFAAIYLLKRSYAQVLLDRPLLLIGTAAVAGVTDRIDSLSEGRSRPAEPSARARHPLVQWLINETSRWTARLLPDDDAKRTRLQQRIQHAGIYNQAAANFFVTARLMLMIVPIPVAIIAGRLGMIAPQWALPFGTIAGATGMLLPSFWLDRRKARRQAVLTRSLPDFLDLLVTCLESGLTLDAALRRVSSELRFAHPVLTVEMDRVQAEIDFGASPDAALHSLAERTDLEPIHTLATFINQARRYGSSVSSALRTHGEMLREQREQRAEEMAQKAAVKILFPTLLFIFPAALVLMAISLPMLFGVLGLVIDGGMLMKEHRGLQTVADAAATTAAREISKNKSTAEVTLTVETLVEQHNGLANSTVVVNHPPVSGPFAGNTKFVEVILSHVIDSYFIHIINGEKSRTVRTRAVAGIKDATAECALMVLDPDPSPVVIDGLPPGLSPITLPALHLGGLEVLGLGTLRVNGAVVVNTLWGGEDENGDPVGEEPSLGGLRHASTCTPLLPLTKVAAEDIRVSGGVGDRRNYGHVDPAESSPLEANKMPAADPFLQRVLAQEQYVVRTAENGRQAEQSIDEFEPQYLITDWNLPDLDGLELCQLIRRRESASYVYVVFITGFSQESSLVTAMETGADDFLAKPVNKHELLARLKAGKRILQMQEQLAELASTDTLSGLLLRRPFMVGLEREFTRSRRNGTPLSAVMFDVDHFKRINDNYGHLVGDNVIRGIGEVVLEQIRASDIPCRYGGEEFCILLPETSLDAATQWAERLRQRITESIVIDDDPRARVTASFGVAEVAPDTQRADDMLVAADDLLLEAKQQGRNRVVSTMASPGQCSSAVVPAEVQTPYANALARDAMTPLNDLLNAQAQISEAVEFLLQNRYSSVPVADENGCFQGICTERALLTLISSHEGKSSSISELTQTSLITVDALSPLKNVVELLDRSAPDAVVVTESDNPCGLIDTKSLLNWHFRNDHTERSLVGHDSAD